MASADRRRLVCDASAGKAAGQARLLDSCNRRGSGKANLGRKDFDLSHFSAQGEKVK